MLFSKSVISNTFDITYYFTSRKCKHIYNIIYISIYLYSVYLQHYLSPTKSMDEDTRKGLFLTPFCAFYRKKGAISDPF